MIRFIIDVFKIAFDPKHYGKVMNELDQEYENQKKIEEELKQLRRDIRNENLGIKSFCRPSAWLEDLARKDKNDTKSTKNDK
jgi:hypothetical protein